MSDDADPVAKAGRHDRQTQVTWSNFWKRPEIVLSIVVGLGGAAWSVVAASQPKPDPVAECRQHHPDANGKPRPVGSGRFTVEGCGQPGNPGVAGDGLWRVEVAIYGIPNTAMVDPYTQVEVFSSTCSVLGIDYFFSNMGASVHNRFMFQNGQIVSGNTGKPENMSAYDVPAEVQQLVRADDRLIVFNNGRNELSAVSCEPLTALTGPQGVR